MNATRPGAGASGRRRSRRPLPGHLEPESWLLFGAGLTLVGVRARRPA